MQTSIICTMKASIFMVHKIDLCEAYVVSTIQIILSVTSYMVMSIIEASKGDLFVSRMEKQVTSYVIDYFCQRITKEGDSDHDYWVLKSGWSI